jgi:carbon-monoxide dehydrogenase iron sulfur subunit
MAINGILEVTAELCTACHTCELECALAHSKSETLADAAMSPEHVYSRMILHQHEETTIPMPCRHCIDAPCIKVCPTPAMSREGLNGPVVLNLRKCIGCNACVMVCPYGVIQNIPGRVGLMKCDLCKARLEQDEIPACAASCPTDAIRFTEVDLISEKKRETVARKFGKSVWQFKIDAEACTGCMLCAKKCPYEAITGEKKEAHTIHNDKCVNCGVCFAVCKFDAVLKLSAEDIIPCAECGEPVGAGTHMDSIKTKITVDEELLGLCPSCRRKRISALQTVAQ